MNNKMENNNFHTVGTILKSHIKLVERCKIDNLNTQIHDCSLSWLGPGTLIKSGGGKLVLCTQISLLIACIHASVFHV